MYKAERIFDFFEYFLQKQKENKGNVQCFPWTKVNVHILSSVKKELWYILNIVLHEIARDRVKNLLIN